MGREIWGPLCWGLQATIASVTWPVSHAPIAGCGRPPFRLASRSIYSNWTLGSACDDPGCAWDKVPGVGLGGDNHRDARAQCPRKVDSKVLLERAPSGASLVSEVARWRCPKGFVAWTLRTLPVSGWETRERAEWVGRPRPTALRTGKVFLQGLPNQSRCCFSPLAAPDLRLSSRNLL